MPSSSSESSSSKGFGARCFWRLMMISPSFLFERTARRVLSSLCFFVFLLEKGPKKKSISRSLFFFLGPFCFMSLLRRERERDVKKRRGKKATKAPTSSRRQNAKVRRQKKNKRKKFCRKLSLSLLRTLSR